MPTDLKRLKPQPLTVKIGDETMTALEINLDSPVIPAIVNLLRTGRLELYDPTTQLSETQFTELLRTAAELIGDRRLVLRWRPAKAPVGSIIEAGISLSAVPVSSLPIPSAVTEEDSNGDEDDEDLSEDEDEDIPDDEDEEDPSDDEGEDDDEDDDEDE